MGYFFGSVAGLALYVLLALGLYGMALNKKLENPWLAWIPIANFYILGKLINTLYIGTFNVPYVEYVLPIGLFLTCLPLGFLRSLILIVFAVLMIFTLLKLYKMYAAGKETLYTVLSIVLPFMLPIFIFMIKDNTPVEFE